MGEWISRVGAMIVMRKNERGMFGILVIRDNFGVDVGVFSAVPTPSGFGDKDENSTPSTCWNMKFYCF